MSINNKRIKLDLNLNDIENIITFNYEKNNYQTIVNLYQDIKNENISDYASFILCLSFIKLERYDESIDVLINHKFNNNSNNIYVLFVKFFMLDHFLKDYTDLDFKNIREYILGYVYKKLNNIQKSLIYFKSCKNIAQEKILIFFVRHIDNEIIELYETDKNKYFNDLLNLYKLNDLHKKVIELYEFKNMNENLNSYIKDIIQDEYIFMLDNDNIEYYLNKFVISDESDIMFLLEKYVNLNKINDIEKLLNISFEQNLSDSIKINILYELIKLNNKKLKYCEQIFELFENNDYSNNINLQNILKIIIEYYNNELIYSHKLGNQKYKKYLNNKNLDRINNNYASYLNLYKYFDLNNIKKDKCVICLKENIEIITLNCHHTHICCYKCYNRIDKCPLCRDNIFK